MSKGLSSLHKKLLFKPIPPEVLALTFLDITLKVMIQAYHLGK